MGLGIGLAHRLASMGIEIPHLGIGIGYWIGSKFIEHVNIYQQIHLLIWGSLELGLGIVLALSLSSMSILIPHLGIGIGYWIGFKFIEDVYLSTKSSSHMGELELGIGLGQCSSSMYFHKQIIFRYGGPLNWD